MTSGNLRAQVHELHGDIGGEQSGSRDLKNSPGVNGTDPRNIQIDPYYDVAIAPASTSITSLPTNGGSLTATFTLQNIGAASDSYDLLTTKVPGTASPSCRSRGRRSRKAPIRTARAAVRSRARAR